jgi:hypothetical protein
MCSTHASTEAVHIYEARGLFVGHIAGASGA